MAAKLVDDTRCPSVGIYGPELGNEFAKISQFRVDRYNTYGWARNLRFLTYDNGDDDEDEKGKDMVELGEEAGNEEDSDGGLQRAIEPSTLQDGEEIDPELGDGKKQGAESTDFTWLMGLIPADRSAQ
jgi:hypothetical protein